MIKNSFYINVQFQKKIIRQLRTIENDTGTKPDPYQNYMQIQNTEVRYSYYLCSIHCTGAIPNELSSSKLRVPRDSGSGHQNNKMLFSLFVVIL